MFSFRHKIIITYLIVFLGATALIYPFATYFVNSLIYKGMEDRADEFIAKIRSAPSNEGLIRRLKAEKHLIFFRVSIISDTKNILYDSHTKRLLGPRFTQEFVVEHPEVLEAFRKGIGFTSDYSDILGRKFVYFAKAFDFHGKLYVIRIAFPYNYVEEVSTDLRIGILAFVVMILFIFSIMTWLIVNRLTSPIQTIIETIRSYKEDTKDQLPRVQLDITNPQDDFFRLADTLNSLSDRIQIHINTLVLERNEKEAVLESLSEGVVAVDESMYVIYANSMALDMLGMTREGLIGHSFDVANQEEAAQQLRTSQAQNETLTDTLEIKKDGRRIYINMITTCKGGDSGVILVLQDQSQHYRILNMRRNFIANASHELKTPITIIRGFAETLHENPQLPKNIVHDVTGKIVKNCNRMTSLIKDLLALSDIENLPESRLIEIDLTDLLEQCKQTLLTIFPDAQIKIVTEEKAPFVLTGDPSLLEMAFYNLMNNSAKYSEPPAQITITLIHVDNEIQMTFSDNGIGIPQKDLEYIFQRFYTVDSKRSKRMGGSGLGLSIVETILEKHFGTISVESTENVGTTFTLLFPIVSPF